MDKGDRTHEAILTAGVEHACRVGLGGLSIGTLAAEVGLSKSGMYAHFGSKEALQLEILDAAGREFAAEVVIPALRAPRGEERVRDLFERWLACGFMRRPGGCLFVKASAELDEQPGPVLDHLREQHAEINRTVARVFVGGVTQGQFRPDADPEQFASDFYGVVLGFYHRHRLLADPGAEARARAALEALLDAVRPVGSAEVPAAHKVSAPPGPSTSREAPASRVAPASRDSKETHR